ncbi:hypothetical protein [Lentzea sp. NPDC059081]|uniref:hypothetical protein n=1 Tax=Lentzea sp. NPDC059081 TaxID=3346719 RepID=UPI0036C14D3C
MGETLQYDIEDHPDLQDAAWMRGANRRAKRDVRRQKRRVKARRHSGKIVAAVALLAVGAVVFGLYRAGTFANVSLPKAPDVHLPHSGVNVEQPFTGTPAEQWSDGERGIVLPSTDPAFEQVRQALIASRLDPAMLVEHKPDRFLSMLAPGSREHVATDVSMVATRLEQGMKLLPNGIRVSGKMTLGQGANYPAVTADYVFAYAFEPPDPRKLTTQMEIVAAVRHQVTFEITPEGLWLTKSSSFQYSIGCEASKAGFLAPQFSERPKNVGGQYDDEKHFSVDGPVPTDGNCD